MPWRCLRCQSPRGGDDEPWCGVCGHKRDLSRRPRGAPVQPNVFAVPSDTPGNPPHVLTVLRDRSVECSTCMAGVYNKKCHAAREYEELLLKHRDKELVQVLNTEQRQKSVLFRHDEARNSKVLATVWYFDDWHPGVLDLPARDFLHWLLDYYGGNHLERVRRVTAHIQNDLKLYPADAEVGPFLKVNEEVYHGLFQGSVPG